MALNYRPSLSKSVLTDRANSSKLAPGLKQSTHVHHVGIMLSVCELNLTGHFVAIKCRSQSSRANLILCPGIMGHKAYSIHNAMNQFI